jgi:hypothetical protein
MIIRTSCNFNKFRHLTVKKNGILLSIFCQRFQKIVIIHEKEKNFCRISPGGR